MLYLKVVFILLICTGCSFQPLYSLKEREKFIENFHYKIIYYGKQNQSINFFLSNELEKVLKTKNKSECKYLIKIDYKVHKSDYLTLSNSSPKKKKVQVLLNYSIFDYKNRIVLLSDKLIDDDTYSLTTIPYFNFLNEEKLVVKILIALVQKLKIQIIKRFSKL